MRRRRRRQSKELEQPSIGPPMPRHRPYPHQLLSFAGSQSSAAQCAGHGAGGGGAGSRPRRCAAALIALATAAAPGAALGVNAVSAHASSWKRPIIVGGSRWHRTTQSDNVQGHTKLRRTHQRAADDGRDGHRVGDEEHAARPATGAVFGDGGDGGGPGRLGAGSDAAQRLATLLRPGHRAQVAQRRHLLRWRLS